MSNYSQPDFRVPTPPIDSTGRQLGNVTVQPHQAGAPSGNPLNLSAPVAVFSQPGRSAPNPPVSGQLSTTSPGSIGVSGEVRSDGSRIF